MRAYVCVCDLIGFNCHKYFSMCVYVCVFVSSLITKKKRPNHSRHLLLLIIMEMKCQQQEKNFFLFPKNISTYKLSSGISILFQIQNYAQKKPWNIDSFDVWNLVFFFILSLIIPHLMNWKSIFFPFCYKVFFSF